MRDMKLNGMINVLAAGSLLVTASGCGGNSPEDLARDLCEAYETCDADDFEDSYDSMDDCIEENTPSDEEVQEFKDAFGEDCYDALLDYAACGYAEYKSACEDYDDEACESEAEKAEDVCDFDDDYDYYDY